MSIEDAINDLSTKHSGTADFIVLDDGTVIHDVTVFTAKLGGSTPREFFSQAAADGTIRPGDRVQVPANNGRYDFVRIIRASKATA